MDRKSVERLFAQAQAYSLKCQYLAREVYSAVWRWGEGGDIHPVIGAYLQLQSHIRADTGPYFPLQFVDPALTRTREAGPFVGWHGRLFRNAHHATMCMA